MSILGLTIDYGPYGWLENYDPTWAPNTTDAHGRRYCYGRQPQIAHWNLAQLANALLPLVGDPEPLEQPLRDYPRLFEQGWMEAVAAKLGLVAYIAETDQVLVQELFRLLPLVETDITLFFRQLAEVSVQPGPEQSRLNPLLPAYYRPEQLTPAYRQQILAWLDQYGERLRQDGLTDPARRERMDAVNPRYVLRNYLAQLAIDAASQGDFTPVRELLDLLRRPYDEQPGRERYSEKRPEWARHRPGCSMLSCSS
jgi:uncharacterized protein YdiU (UPF0061 family)